MAKTIEQTSAGGIVFRRLDDHIQVALIARTRARRKPSRARASTTSPTETIWALPKGWVEPGETVPDAALREIREETGLTGRLVEPLGQIAYVFYSAEAHARIHKTVHFYLVEYLSGDTADHDHEVDEARWWPLESAGAQLAYQSERDILAKAMTRLLADCAPPTA